ncbi:hypothetical protein [Streptomyces sp. NPDC054888]
MAVAFSKSGSSSPIALVPVCEPSGSVQDRAPQRLLTRWTPTAPICSR